MDRHDALELYTEVKAVTVRLSKIAGERKDQRKEYKLVRAGGARTDLTRFRRAIVRRGPSLPNLVRLLVGRNALPEHPAHITLGGGTSASKTPNAM
jgi:hypothetical protein